MPSQGTFFHDVEQNSNIFMKMLVSELWYRKILYIFWMKILLKNLTRAQDCLLISHTKNHCWGWPHEMCVEAALTHILYFYITLSTAITNLKQRKSFQERLVNVPTSDLNLDHGYFVPAHPLFQVRFSAHLFSEVTFSGSLFHHHLHLSPALQSPPRI